MDIFRSKIDICVKFWLPRHSVVPKIHVFPQNLKNQIFSVQTAPVRGLSCHNKPAQEVSSNCDQWTARKDELPAFTHTAIVAAHALCSVCDHGSEHMTKHKRDPRVKGGVVSFLLNLP